MTRPDDLTIVATTILEQDPTPQYMLEALMPPIAEKLRSAGHGDAADLVYTLIPRMDTPS